MSRDNIRFFFALSWGVPEGKPGPPRPSPPVRSPRRLVLGCPQSSRPVRAGASGSARLVARAKQQPGPLALALSQLVQGPSRDASSDPLLLSRERGSAYGPVRRARLSSKAAAGTRRSPNGARAETEPAMSVQIQRLPPGCVRRISVFTATDTGVFTATDPGRNAVGPLRS